MGILDRFQKTLADVDKVTVFLQQLAADDSPWLQLMVDYELELAEKPGVAEFKEQMDGLLGGLGLFPGEPGGTSITRMRYRKYRTAMVANGIADAQVETRSFRKLRRNWSDRNTDFSKEASILTEVSYAKMSTEKLCDDFGPILKDGTSESRKEFVGLMLYDNFRIGKTVLKLAETYRF